MNKYIIVYYTESRYFGFKRKHYIEVDSKELCNFTIKNLENDLEFEVYIKLDDYVRRLKNDNEK